MRDCLMEINALTLGYAERLDRIPAPPSLKFAVVPMLFDHICERYGMQKDEMREVFCDITTRVQETMGDMYAKE